MLEGLGPVILAALVASIGVLGVFYALACTVRDQVELHELKIRVINARNERMAYLRQLSESETVVTDLELPGVNAETGSQHEQMVGGHAHGKRKR
jgi:hypothetical protein